tara:strand:+ start:644553 stop:647375 length:2823 start_codon:yes stop_codon:yes gene_type:complete
LPITDKDLAASYLLRTFYAKAGVRVDPENPDGSLIEAEFDDVPTGVLEKVEQFGGIIIGAGRREGGGPIYIRARVPEPTHQARATIQTAKQIVEQERTSIRPDNPRLKFSAANVKRSPAMMALLKGAAEKGDVRAPRMLGFLFADHDRTIIESRMEAVPEGFADELRLYGATKWAHKRNDDGSTSFRIEFDVPYDNARRKTYDALELEPQKAAAPSTQKPFIIMSDECGVLNQNNAGANMLRDFAHEMADQGVKVEFVSISLFSKSTLKGFSWGDDESLKPLRHSTWHVEDSGNKVKKFIEKNKANWAGWIELKDDSFFEDRYRSPEEAALHGIRIRGFGGIERKPETIDTIRALVKKQLGREFGQESAMVYSFAAHQAEGLGQPKADLGGKGQGLMNMANQGMPVPPGFVTTTRVCSEFYETGELSEDLADEMAYGLQKIEAEMGQTFGDAKNPLLLSVRSGAPVSMPGMMETVLNIGMNDETVEALAQKGEGRFGYDCYRRLIESYGAAVNDIDADIFKQNQTKALKEQGYAHLSQADETTFARITELHKQSYYEVTGEAFPQSVWAQLEGANEAVFDSWETERCQAYREANGIPKSMYTAATTQAMVFGNRNERSGSGVLFTRDPNTGERKLTGQWLQNCQGEDVVSGRHKTQSIETLAETMPEVYEELKQHVEFLEATEKDVQDVEFTIEDGKLYMLQTRNAKRSPEAAIKIAADMAREGLIEKPEAVRRVKNIGIDQLVNMEVDTSAPEYEKAEVLLEGQAVCSGAVNGIAVVNDKQARYQREIGENPIVFARDSLTEDISMMQNANGMAVFGGSEASHAAVVARGMGLPYVCDLPQPDAVVNDYVELQGGTKLYVGDKVCLDAMTGRIFKDHLPLKQKELSNDLLDIAEWDKEVAVQEGDTPTLYEAVERVRAEQAGEPVYDNILQEVVFGQRD